MTPRTLEQCPQIKARPHALDEWERGWLEHWSKAGTLGYELPKSGPAGEEAAFLTEVRSPEKETVCTILNRQQFHATLLQGALPARGVSIKVRRSPPKANLGSPAFDVQLFLDSAGLGRRVRKFPGKETIFGQGDPATNVIYIQEGGVRLTVVNESGKVAVVAIRGPGDFFGEGCLAGQSICMATATTVAPTAVMVIEKDEMIRALHAEHEFSDRFIAYMLARNIRVEEDLVDQLFNSSEKRLARTLLLLARYGKQGQPQQVLPKVSQEMLAEMIGTTRSRVNFFMNKFRKLGFIQYNGEIHVNNSLLSVVLHD
jgi:CRP/FNR family transcriptional regulator, cyclic AMP receptor protein